MIGGAAEPCRLLGWDSEFFGRRIARLDAPRLDPALAARVLAWCRRESVACLYLLVAAADGETVRVAEDAGFRLVDVRATLERTVAGEEGTRPRVPDRDGVGRTAIRGPRPEDLPSLKALAVANHRDTRFHRDPTFSTTEAEALYARWIERSCGGWADRVFVADRGDGPIGYVTCHGAAGAAAGQIGLVGVDARFRGKGIGSWLLSEALGWFAERKVACVTVATQGGNIGALRLYERAGFQLGALELWYHRAFP